MLLFCGMVVVVVVVFFALFSKRFSKKTGLISHPTPPINTTPPKGSGVLSYNFNKRNSKYVIFKNEKME